MLAWSRLETGPKHDVADGLRHDRCGVGVGQSEAGEGQHQDVR